ncbi:Na+ dependent nucleoside transporter N-terminal domain-containing protein, partial [Klebsiella michiganensis]|uniref:Na+ dependent nucleoside transporter N-terminal domain-containing protein n=1 Tax=Klebsiella michiganensis TaxID=1134687 RepID=UPI002B1CB61B
MKYSAACFPGGAALTELRVPRVCDPVARTGAQRRLRDGVGVMLYFPPGKWLVEQAALGVHKVMSYSDAGSAFIFGSLVGPK